MELLKINTNTPIIFRIIQFKQMTFYHNHQGNCRAFNFYISLCLVFFASSNILAQQATEQRPNIIFLLTDDQRMDAMSYTGNTVLRTPEMDKLAEEGVFFQNAFVTTPICAASRASIMTGTYERTHGYTFQQPPLSRELIQTSYFAELKKAGYFTGFLGKLGVNFEDGLDQSAFDVYQPESTGFYWRLDNEATEHIHLTDLTGRNAENFIRDAPDEKPFMLSLSYNAPHAEDRSPDQYLWPSALDTFYQNAQIPGPAFAEDDYFNRLPEPVRNGFNRVRWHWRYDTPEKYQKMVKGYYRMITGIDRTIGHIRKALEDKGVADNTVIILMGDNGFFLGERQLAGKWLMYDLSLRVPLLIYDPRNNVHRDIADLALNIDIAPTILDFAQIEIPDSYQGKSLAGYSRGENPLADRQSFLCEHLWQFKWIPPSEGIRSKKWKYFRYINDPEIEELYDLENDPEEIYNLIDKPEYEEVLRELKEELGGYE